MDIALASFLPALATPEAPRATPVPAMAGAPLVAATSSVTVAAARPGDVAVTLIVPGARPARTTATAFPPNAATSGAWYPAALSWRPLSVPATVPDLVLRSFEPPDEVLALLFGQCYDEDQMWLRIKPSPDDRSSLRSSGPGE